MLSVVSYEERGKGGNNLYRGNCSPKLIKDLINQFKVTEICDFMVGSGTTEDVAKELNINSNCFDLNRGFDLLEDDINLASEFIFFHPPYWDIIKYSGNMYGSNPLQSDLSQIPDYYEFIKKLNTCVMKQYYSLEKGGHIAILMGDIKKKGTLYSMLLDIIKPGKLINKIVKVQNNCTSYRKEYTNYNFIPIVHEDLIILQKPIDKSFLLRFSKNENYEVDIRDSKVITWKQLVIATLENLGPKASLSNIYNCIKNNKKCQYNPNWEAKVRQTLQLHSDFKNIKRGVWSLAN